MSTLHIAQHAPDGATRFYLLQPGQPGDRFRGVVIPLNDPARSRRLQLRVKFSNPAFIRSLSAQLATGTATFRVRNNDGQTLAIAASRVQGTVIYQATDGPTLIAASGADEEAEAAAVAPTTAVAAVAIVAILVIGAVGVAAMGGAFSGRAESGEDKTAVEVEASGEGEGDGGEGGEGNGEGGGQAQ